MNVLRIDPATDHWAPTSGGHPAPALGQAHPRPSRRVGGRRPGPARLGRHLLRQAARPARGRGGRRLAGPHQRDRGGVNRENGGPDPLHERPHGDTMQVHNHATTTGDRRSTPGGWDLTPGSQHAVSEALRDGRGGTPPPQGVPGNRPRPTPKTSAPSATPSPGHARDVRRAVLRAPARRPAHARLPPRPRAAAEAQGVAGGVFLAAAGGRVRRAPTSRAGCASASPTSASACPRSGIWARTTSTSS